MSKITYLKAEYSIKTESKKGQVDFDVNIFNPPNANEKQALEIALPQIAEQLNCQFTITDIKLIRYIQREPGQC